MEMFFADCDKSYGHFAHMIATVIIHLKNRHYKIINRNR